MAETPIYQERGAWVAESSILKRRGAWVAETPLYQVEGRGCFRPQYIRWRGVGV